jgi:hypothetical protein
VMQSVIESLKKKIKALMQKGTFSLFFILH